MAPAMVCHVENAYYYYLNIRWLLNTHNLSERLPVGGDELIVFSSRLRSRKRQI